MGGGFTCSQINGIINKDIVVRNTKANDFHKYGLRKNSILIVIEGGLFELLLT